MKKTLKNAIEIKNAGGAVMASYWTTGSGRHTSRRPVPQFCDEIILCDGKLRPPTERHHRFSDIIIAWGPEVKGKTLKAIKRIIRRHPRATKFIAVTDWRGLNAAYKDLWKCDKIFRSAIEAEKIMCKECAAIIREQPGYWLGQKMAVKKASTGGNRLYVDVAGQWRDASLKDM